MLQLCILSQIKGSRQKKRSFYGQADRKGCPIPLLVGNTEPEGGGGTQVITYQEFELHIGCHWHIGGRDAHRVKRDEHPSLP